MNAARLARTIRDWGASQALGGARHWNRFWFTPADVATLATIRMLTGLVLLYVHTTSLPLFLDATGPNGWVDAQAWNELAQLDSAYRWSLWSHLQSPAASLCGYGLLVAAIACLTVGFSSRLAAVVVWLGQLSFAQRGFPLTYGLDSIAAFLTLYLVIGPCGRAFSADRWLATRRAARGRASLVPEPETSITANLAIRCIQLHMCIVYLFAGLAKLQGTLWWSGRATYYAAMSPEMWPMEIGVQWVGRCPQVAESLSNLTVLFTLAFEISFAFVVWNKPLRPFLLAAAVLLHLGTGLTMGLGAFGVIMLAGCGAFVAPATWRAVAGFLCRRLPAMRHSRLCPSFRHNAYR